MSLFNKKSTSESEKPGGNNNDGKNKLSLLILLMLVGIFAYIYFFTSIIVPHETATPKPSATPPEIKQSMPPRPAGIMAQTSSSSNTKGPAVINSTPAAKPAAPPTAKQAAPVPPATKPSPAAQPQPVSSKPAAQTPATAKKEALKPSKAAEAKPAVKKESLKSSNPEPKTDPAEKVTKSNPSKKKMAAFVIAAGEFPAGAAVAAAEAKLEKHGVRPVLKQVSKKGREVSRLFVNTFNDYDSYAASLETVKRSAKSAFGIEMNGNYQIFAGSFNSPELAQKEKTRLQNKGIKIEIQKTFLPGTTIKVTAGSFATKAAANKAATELAKDGLAVKVIPKGR